MLSHWNSSIQGFWYHRYKVFFRRNQMFSLLHFFHSVWWINGITKYARINWDACLPPERLTVYVDDLAFFHSFHVTFLNLSNKCHYKVRIYNWQFWQNQRLDPKCPILTSFHAHDSVPYIKRRQNMLSQDQGIKLTLLWKSTCRPSFVLPNGFLQSELTSWYFKTPKNTF